MSTRRRKPLKTYPSPISVMPSNLRLETGPRKLVHTPLSSSSSKSSSPSIFPPIPRANDRKRPLPLYHPLAPLASSLPILDFTALGLPPIALPESPTPPRQQPQQVQQPTEPPTDVPSDTGPKPPPSPRKRRTKRKRVDQEDTTYPAKRTRSTRATAAVNSPPESTVAVGEDPGSIPDLMERSLRSRAPVKRRGSSASEVTVSSASAPSAANAAANTRGSVTPVARPASPRESKEDGEL